MVLGGLRAFLDGDSAPRVELLGDVVFTAVYAMPFLLAAAVSTVPDRGVGGALLAPLAFASLLATISSLSGVALLLVPATVLLMIASYQGLRGAGHWIRNLALAGTGLIGAVAILISFLALFAIGGDDTRCWALTKTESGREEWVAVEPGGLPGTLSLSVGPQVRQSSCTSDVVTDGEALTALAVLLVAPAVFGGAVWLGRKSSLDAEVDTLSSPG